jgi:hypothetical protein
MGPSLCEKFFMVRRSRVHFPGAFYPMIAMGNQRQDIFLDRADLPIHLANLSEHQSKVSFHLYACALLKTPFIFLWEWKKFYSFCRTEIPLFERQADPNRICK